VRGLVIPAGAAAAAAAAAALGFSPSPAATGMPKSPSGRRRFAGASGASSTAAGMGHQAFATTRPPLRPPPLPPLAPRLPALLLTLLRPQPEGALSLARRGAGGLAFPCPGDASSAFLACRRRSAAASSPPAPRANGLWVARAPIAAASARRASHRRAHAAERCVATSTRKRFEGAHKRLTK
jgi:hypothetical protein